MRNKNNKYIIFKLSIKIINRGVHICHLPINVVRPEGEFDMFDQNPIYCERMSSNCSLS